MINLFVGSGRTYIEPDLSLAGDNLGTGWRRRWWSSNETDINEFLDVVFEDIAPGQCRKFLSSEVVHNAEDF